MTRLQLALDHSLESGLQLLDQVSKWVDLVELGTPLVIREGIRAAHVVRREFPEMPLLADLKIMDAGELEASIAFEAGCQWVTVLGTASNATVRGVLAAATQFSGYAMADLINVTDPVSRGRELLTLGCHMLCVHTAYDLQAAGHAPLTTLAALRTTLPHAPLAVAGGINAHVVRDVMRFSPQVVVVGGAIDRAADPAAAARQIQRAIEEL